mmetsp:Transcript_18096/g.28053  ORF Transcript_18096/g.28053 Transcript_18096/m.28053 type:complete len:516 (-) Transcript_18096:360-1907(-)
MGLRLLILAAAVTGAAAYQPSSMLLRSAAGLRNKASAFTPGLSALRPRLYSRPQRRSQSGIVFAQGSISSLYQAKGRTDEALTEVAEALAKKKFELDKATILEVEAQRKVVQAEMSEMQQERNSKSKSIGKLKAQGEDISEVLKEVDGLKSKLQESEAKMKEIEEQMETMLLSIPNGPHSSVPEGEDEDANVEVTKWGEIPEFDFKVKDHVDVGAKLNGMDFPTATKISGARFVMLQGQVARLHRALAQYMLDTHTTKHGYEEVNVPFIVNEDSLYGTGQLPKFAEDLFSTRHQDRDFYLIPTAEVPVTNIVRDTIVTEDELPIRFTAHTPCFRSEAGSYGRDTRGLIRQHQFEKVELIQFVHPDKSYEALEELTGHAETILQSLGLPYRKVELCTGDLGFSASKTYDLEVWLPAQETYREISSCSNCEDFQARRMKARFKSSKGNELLHTLNGSGLAVGRTLVAILENFQKEDGSVAIPKVLQRYMNDQEVIMPPPPKASAKKEKGGKQEKAKK